MLEEILNLALIPLKSSLKNLEVKAKAFPTTFKAACWVLAVSHKKKRIYRLIDSLTNLD